MNKSDKAYAKHQAEQDIDRPKEFGLSGAMTTEEYLRYWCAENGLKHDDATAELRKQIEDQRRRLRGPKGKLP